MVNGLCPFVSIGKTKKRVISDSLFVGIPGFEPGTPCSQNRCATGLRYIPKNLTR